MTRDFLGGTIITQWTEVGSWRRGPGAPNGSCAGGMERHAIRRTLYSASYNGRPHKLFLDTTVLFQTEFNRAPRALPGGSNDGHPFRISQCAARAGVTF